MDRRKGNENSRLTSPFRRGITYIIISCPFSSTPNPRAVKPNLTQGARSRITCPLNGRTVKSSTPPNDLVDNPVQTITACALPTGLSVVPIDYFSWAFHLESKRESDSDTAPSSVIPWRPSIISTRCWTCRRTIFPPRAIKRAWSHFRYSGTSIVTVSKVHPETAPSGNSEDGITLY